jgi:salicylate synthetase
MSVGERYHELRVAERCDPMAVVAALANSNLFDRYFVYERAGKWWFAGGAGAEVIATRDRITASWNGTRRGHDWDGRTMSTLAGALAEIPVGRWRAYGWATFELAHALLGLTGLPDAGPLLHLLVPRTEVRIDGEGVRIRSLSQLSLSDTWDVIAKAGTPTDRGTVALDVEVGADAYQADVQFAVDAINRRELEKVILSRRLPVEGPVDLVGTYLRGRAGNTPARSFLLDLGGWRAAGFSPETIAEVDRSGRVSSQPLAGTRAFGAGGIEDARLRLELLTDQKEVFEHVISVRRSFDDLVEVCQPATVGVEDLMSVRERGSVQHLGSRVSGRLAPGRLGLDALAALFPAVTASGISKQAACTMITDLEDRPRGLYGGAMMMLDSGGSLDAALVLRSIYERGGETWLQAGAGIVGASRPEREFRETCEKFASISRFVVPRVTEPSTVGAGVSDVDAVPAVAGGRG